MTNSSDPATRWSPAARWASSVDDTTAMPDAATVEQKLREATHAR